MQSMIEELKEIIGVPIRLNIFAPPGAGSMQNNNFAWTGAIERIRPGVGENDAGVLIFKHTSAEAARLQVKRSRLNLSGVIVWAVDDLMEGFDAAAYIKCPECTTIIKLEDPQIRLGHEEDDLVDKEPEIEESKDE